jgi:signal transduction histidine kinase
MRERATEIGGRLAVDSGPEGTRVRAWLPLPAAEGSA